MEKNARFAVLTLLMSCPVAAGAQETQVLLRAVEDFAGPYPLSHVANLVGNSHGGFAATANFQDQIPNTPFWSKEIQGRRTFGPTTFLVDPNSNAGGYNTSPSASSRAAAMDDEGRILYHKLISPNSGNPSDTIPSLWLWDPTAAEPDVLFLKAGEAIPTVPNRFLGGFPRSA